MSTSSSNSHPPATPDPAAAPRRSWDEADIGSGEKTPGQHETDELIRQIPPLPDDADGKPAAPPGQAPTSPPSTR